MAKQKSKKQQGSLTLEEIYNALMYDIEPELMTDMIPELDEIYANETEEEREERAERYARAFEMFSDEFENILALWKTELLTFKKQALASFKTQSTAEDAEHLLNIEHSIDDQ